MIYEGRGLINHGLAELVETTLYTVITVIKDRNNYVLLLWLGWLSTAAAV